MTKKSAKESVWKCGLCGKDCGSGLELMKHAKAGHEDWEYMSVRKTTEDRLADLESRIQKLERRRK